MPETPPSPPAELLPPDSTSISADNELALSAVVPDLTADATAVEETRPVPFGKSWSWDDVAQRFVRFGGAPAETFGQDTAVAVARNAISILRLSCPIFDDEVGMDDPWLFLHEPLNALTKTQWEDDLREALSIEPRFTKVSDFTYDQLNDVITYTFQITMDDGNAVTISDTVGS